jgi:hypothetical protein
VDATDKFLQKLKIDDQNRIRTDSMAGASAFDLSVQSGKLGLGKAGSRLGYKIFEGAAEKGGIKLLSSVAGVRFLECECLTFRLVKSKRSSFCYKLYC